MLLLKLFVVPVAANWIFSSVNYPGSVQAVSMIVYTVCGTDCSKIGFIQCELDKMKLCAALFFANVISSVTVQSEYKFQVNGSYYNENDLTLYSCTSIQQTNRSIYLQLYSYLLGSLGNRKKTNICSSSNIVICILTKYNCTTLVVFRHFNVFKCAANIFYNHHR